MKKRERTLHKKYPNSVIFSRIIIRHPTSKVPHEHISADARGKLDGHKALASGSHGAGVIIKLGEVDVKLVKWGDQIRA